MRRAQHPAIVQIGHIHDIGNGALVVHNWGLTLCATGCLCHRHPITGQPVLLEDQVGGHLGLVSYAPGGCYCCDPWSVYELADVLRDLADIAALEPQEPLTG